MLVLLVGLGIMLYPLVSNLYNEELAEEAQEYYDSIVYEEVAEEDRSAEFQECWDYNEGLTKGGVLLTDPFDEAQLDPTAMPYAGLLNIDGNGMMGYLEIPAIDLKINIYHGTEEEVLQKGAGHLQGTSLPVGGTGSHSVISAHTGLNDKKLFTDLDQLVIGDVFYVHVLGEILAYQVDNIEVVLPEDTESLYINSEEDYVTLVTCTPYGINTHRLLVRGTRVPYEEAKVVEEQTETRGSTWVDEYLHAVVVGLVSVVVLVVTLVLLRVRAARKAASRVGAGPGAGAVARGRHFSGGPR